MEIKDDKDADSALSWAPPFWVRWKKKKKKCSTDEVKRHEHKENKSLSGLYDLLV